MQTHSFEDLIEAIANAILHAQRVSEQQHLEMLDSFFDLDKATGQLRAKTVEVHVPALEHGNEDHDPIQVPLVSLVPLNSLKVSEITVEFEAQVAGMKRGRRRAADSHIHFTLGGGGDLNKNNNVKVTVKVTGADAPEGVVRLNDRILKQIH